MAGEGIEPPMQRRSTHGFIEMVLSALITQAAGSRGGGGLMSASKIGWDITTSRTFGRRSTPLL
jgi:hypothetical protein